MDMSLILEALLPSVNESTTGSKRVNETTCGMFCQHPGCWASVRRQQKGIARTVIPVDTDSDDSDSDLDLPKQSVCNLLGDYGEQTDDRYPLSTGGRPSHQWEPVSGTVTRSSRSAESFQKLMAPHNTKGSLYSKSTAISARRGRVPLVEVQEVFDKTDLNSQWDETFVTKQYYMWVPNPRKGPKRTQELPGSRETYQSMPVLMKDLTECMVPPEIEQQREDTIIFDEWPVLKKRQPRTRSPPQRSVNFKKAVAAPPVPPETDLDTEGINELLALPKDALMKVLEHTKKSDFTSKGKLRTILQEYVRYDERARMALNAHELFQQRKMPILKTSTTLSRVEQNKPPIFHMDDEMILDRMSSVNTPVKDKDSVSDARSVDSFPRYKKPLPRIHGGQAAVDKQESPMVDAMITPRSFSKKNRIPAISLGLPELPSGVKTTKPFSYNRQSLVDFSLGPVISPPSTVRSSFSGDYSEHGTTVRVHAPSSFDGKAGYQAIHSVSPALSTHVPQAPAVTPATFMSPTKSAPVFKDYKDLSREPTNVSLNLSQKAMPPSRDVREATLLTSAPSNLSQRQTLSPLDTRVMGTPDELALDTINETAREGVEGSVNSSRKAVADVNEPLSGRREEVVTLTLEPSALTSIHTSASPVVKTARSIESCPSPEQWPLISESSFENMMPRPSVSEPALSARTRHLTSRNLDDGTERDYARKVLDEKMTAESPAPPPPSPEPKDREFRSRKDLKSRDSLSMAPLFEVSELEEGSLTKGMIDEANELRGGRKGERRMKQVRQIHAVIPQAKVEQDKKEEIDENDDVMVSQITVTHVTPKGPDPNVRRGEKVQETFLNVDIPAEEISSLKAEHGSSHQEDISSNNTVIQSTSGTTGSEVSASTVPQGSEQKDEEKDKHGNENENQNDEMMDGVDHDGLLPNEESTLALDNDGPVRENSGKQQSEDSVMSPELVCDSARFLNHELVSPVDGELEDDGGSRMMPLLHEIENEGILEMMDPGVGNQNESEEGPRIAGERADGKATEDMDAQDAAEEKNEMDDPFEVKEEESKAVETKLDNENDVEPPGSFFFGASASASTSSPQQETGEEEKSLEVEVDVDTAAHKETKSDSQVETAAGEDKEMKSNSQIEITADEDKETKSDSQVEIMAGEDKETKSNSQIEITAGEDKETKSDSQVEITAGEDKETKSDSLVETANRPEEIDDKNVEEEPVKETPLEDGQNNDKLVEKAESLSELELTGQSGKVVEEDQSQEEVRNGGEETHRVADEFEIDVNTVEPIEDAKYDGNVDVDVNDENENSGIAIREDVEGCSGDPQYPQDLPEGVTESRVDGQNRDKTEDADSMIVVGNENSSSVQGTQQTEEEVMDTPKDNKTEAGTCSAKETGNALESEAFQSRLEPEGSDTM